MSIISIAIQKGGSGKTTTAINLAAALRDRDHAVLVVDLDPQANLTQAMGIEEDIVPNMYTLLKRNDDGEELEIKKAITSVNGVDLLPSNLDLAAAELELVSAFGRETFLEQILEEVKNEYEYIIIDCPPSIGLLTANAIAASHFVLMPLQPEYLPLKGVHSFMRSLNNIKKRLRLKTEVLGYVLTKFDHRKKLNQKVYEQLKEEFGNQVFDTRIRTNIALAQAQENGVDIFTFNSRCNGAQDYDSLTIEILERLDKLPKKNK